MPPQHVSCVIKPKTSDDSGLSQAIPPFPFHRPNFPLPFLHIPCAGSHQYSNPFYSDFLPFPRSQPDAFLTSRIFRLAGRGGLCPTRIRGLPPTPRRSIRVEERPRCASAEPKVPEPIRELVLQRWRTG